MCILTCLLALSPNDVNSSASLRQSDCILGHESSLPAVHGVFNMGSVLMELGRKKREELKVIKEEERRGRGEEEERRVEESGEGEGKRKERERERAFLVNHTQVLYGKLAYRHRIVVNGIPYCLQSSV